MNFNNSEEREFEIGATGQEGLFVERKPAISMVMACVLAVTTALTTWLWVNQHIENTKLREASKELLRIYQHNINVANNFQMAATNNQASAEYWAGKYAESERRFLRLQSQKIEPHK